MPAFGGEPWRGAAKQQVVENPVVTGTHREAFVTCTVGSPEPVGDQAIWEGNAGGTLTLRFKWTATGAAPGDAPNFANVRVFLPGGAQVGVAWAVPFPAVNTEVTRTFRFDSDPLDNDITDAIRAGTLELYLDWGSTGGLAPWNGDSRGGGSLPPLAAFNWARGYLRAAQTLTAESISNVALAGAEPGLWASPDPIHTRLTLGAVWYEAPTLTYHIISNAGASERSQALAQTALTYDFSWTGTAGNNRRVGNGMVVGSDVKDLRAALTAADFGGDNKFIWAAAGHDASWTRTSELQLDALNRITVDPRFELTTLFHTQTEGQQFLDPPSSGDTPSGQRAFPDVAYLSVRYRNARLEGQNNLTVTLKMWDSQEIASSEASPAHTLSEVTRQRKVAGVTLEDGWLPLQDTGTPTDRNKLPIVWSTTVSGTWRVKSVLTAPADLTGLENYPQGGGGSFWNRNVFLVVGVTNYTSVISIHPENIAHHGTHLTSIDELIPVVYLMDQLDRTKVVLIPENGDYAKILITREHHPTMRTDYFDFVTEEWVPVPNGGDYGVQLDLIRGDQHTVGGDPDIWTVQNHLGGEIFVPDGAAGELDFLIIGDIVKDGVHYPSYAPVTFVGDANKHNEYSVDPIGLALSNVLSQR